MPQGTPKPTPRHTEDIARETCTGLFLQAMDAAKTNTAQGFETAARKFDEAADVCRIAEKEFVRRAEAGPAIQVLEISLHDAPELLAALLGRPFPGGRCTR